MNKSDEIAEKGTHCSKHAELHQQASVRYRKKRPRDQRGTCRDCSAPPVPGRVRCQNHLDRIAAAAKRLKKKHQQLGLCQDCNEPSAPNRTRCQKHLDRIAAAVKRHAIKRVLNHTCEKCPNPAAPNRTLCVHHLAQSATHARFNKADRRGESFEPASPVDRQAEITIERKVRDVLFLADEVIGMLERLYPRSPIGEPPGPYRTTIREFRRRFNTLSARKHTPSSTTVPQS